MNEQIVQILEDMLTRIESLEESNRILTESNHTLIEGNRALMESLDALRNEYEHYVDNSAYEILDDRRGRTSYRYPKVLSVEETLDKLLEGNSSLCRYGDGEFACINGRLRAKFTQTAYPLLAARLEEILLDNSENIMIAIADNYGDLSGYCAQSRREIRSYITPQVRFEQSELLDPDKVYYNTYVTRPHTFLLDDPEGMSRYWDRIRTLWAGRNTVIIEGENTGMGVGNDLLDSCADIRRIIAPAVDAFGKYEKILDAALKQPSDSLFLIALGPVATVLAYDLAMNGRRAVDIGHLDIEYEWMKRGAYRTVIPNKYVNEVVGGTDPSPIDDPEYRAQIVSVI